MELLEDFKKSPDKMASLHDIEDLLDPNASSAGSPEREKALDLLNTHSFYYLAQVYEKTGCPDQAGVCCHITLKKQLELKSYDALDWATNATTLSHHYVVTDKFVSAKVHLAAARFILDKYKGDDFLHKEFACEEDKAVLEEKIQHCGAKIERALGKYSLIMLHKSQDKMVAMQDEDMVVEDVTEDEATIDAITSEFPSVEMDPAISDIPSKLATDFETARAVFLPGQRSYRKAQELFFTFNEHCTDYVEINQDLSSMNKLLVFFETDIDRKFKIHKRRVELLEVPLKELSETYFLMVVRQLLFELGEVHESMMDAKIDKMRNGTDLRVSETIRKVNALVDKSIYYFQRYLKTLNTGKDKTTKPDKYAADSVRPALVANFHLARLYDKYQVPEDSQEKLGYKIQTYANFKAVVEYCKRNEEAAGVVQDELKICQEMVRLLPVKIEKMRRELAGTRQS